MPGPNSIILIDDDPMFNFIHNKVIKKANIDYTVHTFDNAESALEKLNSIALSGGDDMRHIIFLDINMPVLDGWGFLERFSELYRSFMKSCKVFILSSSNDLYDIERSKAYPMVQGFISKPLTVSHLIDIFKEEGVS